MHFVSNMVFLYFLGRRVEVVLGPVHTASLYVISGISGGLLQVWMDPGGSIPVLGASGAISGFFGAYALFFSRSKVADKRLFGLLIPGYLLRIIWIIAFWIILQFLIGFFLNDAQTGGIAIGAHIGGFLAGIAYALVWLAWLRLASRHV
jgi:membrane associated rhomboid family serine protease